MNVSAVVITYNSALHLAECLDSLSFCDQIMVVDVGSLDGSDEIARAKGVEVVYHELAPVVEEIWPDIVPQLKHDWVLHLDPDEIFPSAMALKIKTILSVVPNDVGAISFPYQNYFFQRPLLYTYWGGVNNRPKLFHRDRVNYYKRVHAGVVLKEGYGMMDMPFDEQNVIKHFWVDSFYELFEKHVRYAKKEGVSRYERGRKISWLKPFKSALKSLYLSLIIREGWRGGFTGWFLSFFYALYEYLAWLSLKEYEANLRD